MAPHANHPKRFRNLPYHHHHTTKPSTPKLLPPLQVTTQLQLDTYLDKAEVESNKNALLPRPMPCYYHTRGCTKTFDIAEELSVHVTVDITTDHDHEWCKDCQLGFLDYDDFKRHLVVAPNNIHHYCPVCGYTETKSEETMQLHVQKAHKQSNLTCLGCGLVVNGPVAMLEHFKEGICTALQKRTDIVDPFSEGVELDGICGDECYSNAGVIARLKEASSATSTTSMTSNTATYTESGIRLVQPKPWKEKKEKLVIYRFNCEERAALSYRWMPNHETMEEFGQRCLREGNESALENIPWPGGRPVPTEETARAMKKEASRSMKSLPAVVNKRKLKLKLNSIPSASEVRAAAAAKAIAIGNARSALGLQKNTTSDVPLMPALTPAKPKPLATSLPPRPAAVNSILTPMIPAQTPQEPATVEPTAGSPSLAKETPSRVPSLTCTDTTPPHEPSASPNLAAWDVSSDWQQSKTDWATSVGNWETPMNESNVSWDTSSYGQAGKDWQKSTDDWFGGANDSHKPSNDDMHDHQEKRTKSATVDSGVVPRHKTDAAAVSRRQFMESLVKKTKQADMTAKGRKDRRDGVIDVEDGVKLTKEEKKTESDRW